MAEIIEARAPRTPKQDVDHRFAYHQVSESTGAIMESIRNKHRLAAQYVVKNTPAGREQSLALTHLEEAMFWAVAALARQDDTETPVDPEPPVDPAA